MTCLEEILCGTRVIIGIKDFDGCLKPESNLFINDLPGITLKTAAKVASEEQQSGSKLLKHSVDMAIRHVYDEFKEKLKPYFDTYSIVEIRQIDVFSADTIAPAALERGLVIKRWRSELAKIHIHDLVLKTKTTGAITIKLIDGCTEKTYAVDGVADCIVKKRIDYKAESEEVRIVFDQTAVEVYTCAVHNNLGYNDCRCGSWSGKGLFVTGWNGTAEQGKCFGLGVTASIKCDFENVFCLMLEYLYMAIWYKAGVIFLQDLLQSDRINSVTLFTKERAKEQLEEWQKNYDKKYDAAIQNATLFIKSTKGECIACNGNKVIQLTP